MTSPSDPALHDPRRAFSDIIHTLAHEAIDRGMSGAELIADIHLNDHRRTKNVGEGEEKKSGKTSLKAIMIVIERANPSFKSQLSTPIHDISDPRDLAQVFNKLRKTYIDALLAHYVDAKIEELRTAEAAA